MCLYAQITRKANEISTCFKQTNNTMYYIKWRKLCIQICTMIYKLLLFSEIALYNILNQPASHQTTITQSWRLAFKLHPYKWCNFTPFPSSICIYIWVQCENASTLIGAAHLSRLHPNMHIPYSTTAMSRRKVKRDGG